MKPFLLIALLCFSCTKNFAQSDGVSSLPLGTYTTYSLSNDAKLNKWPHGNVILLDDSRYKLSDEEETGKYRFSATAQRVFFLSGPLEGVFAKTAVSNNKPAIILPQKENEKLQSKFFVTDVVAYYKKE